WIFGDHATSHLCALMLALAMSCYRMKGEFDRGAHARFFSSFHWAECAVPASTCSCRWPAGRTDIFRDHLSIRKCNVRHHGNGIVTRLPGTQVHVVDHPLHEDAHLAGPIALSLSSTLAADVDADPVQSQVRLARGPFLGKFAKLMRLAPKPIERQFRF